MGIKKYRKKPVVIEAIQWNGNNFTEIYTFINGSSPDIRLNIASDRWQDYVDSQITPDRKLKLKTLESDGEYQVADVGDYIIKGVRGEFYPVKKEIFEETYEEVKESKK